MRRRLKSGASPPLLRKMKRISSTPANFSSFPYSIYSPMAPSRGFAFIDTLKTANIGCGCRAYPFSTAVTTYSGHNRWSKIRHDKSKNDAAKNRQRSIFAQEIATASKIFGPDPNFNPRLADLIAKAKKEGFAKNSIEAAIARGQGRSLSGMSLESVTIEGILPNNVGVILECETDNKARTLMEIRFVLKESGGRETPSSYLFQKKGRIVYEKKDGIGIDQALEPALEAGATDVEEDEQGRLVISCEPSDTKAVGEVITNALNLHVGTSEIVWEPNEDTKVVVPDEQAAQQLHDFIDQVHDRDAGVQAVAMNISQGQLNDDIWRELQARLA